MSATQQEAVEMIKQHGGILRRLKGGFWTWPDCQCNDMGVPQWYCGTNTINAMIRLGLVFISDRRSYGPVEVTQSPALAE